MGQTLAPRGANRLRKNPCQDLLSENGSVILVAGAPWAIENYR